MTRDWVMVATLVATVAISVVGGVAAKHKSNLEAKIRAMPAAAPQTPLGCAKP